MATAALGTISKEAYTADTKAVVKATFAQKTKTTTDKFILPNRELGIVTEMLNRDNPLAPYIMVDIADSTAGSVEVKYDVYNDNWKIKDSKGGSQNGGADVIIDNEIFKWNKPFEKEESVEAGDLKRGVPNTLASRMNTASIKFIQRSIKDAFKEFVDKAVLAESTAVAAIDFTTRDKLTQSKITLLQAVAKFARENEINKGDLVITLSDDAFEALAEQGMIGNRTEKTYAGGTFSVGVMSGYRVQGGGMYLPATATSSKSGSAKTSEVVAFIGTDKVGLHAIDFEAANYGKLGLTNDLGTYLQMSDIYGSLDYKGKFGKSQSFVLTQASILA